MFKSRMLDNVKQSRYIPPIWLAVILSIVFVYGCEIVGGLALVPISILLGLVLVWGGLCNYTRTDITLYDFHPTLPLFLYYFGSLSLGEMR